MMLPGCAAPGPQLFSHSTANQEQFARDLAQCEYESLQAVSGYSQGRRRDGIGASMALGIREGLEIGDPRNQLEILCLKTKDYSPNPRRA
jgi:hypothetical protein